MRKIRTIIVDDEPLACQELIFLLNGFEQFEVIDSFNNYETALAGIQAKRPDLLLLDIDLGQRSGFDLIEALDILPEVVFITAYNQYALKAFETNAIDYLLKPVSNERLEKTLLKAARQLQYSIGSVTSERSLSKDSKVFLREGDDCFLVKLYDIFLIESLGNYCRVFFDNQKLLLKKSLAQLEEKLPTELFFRANRNQIINIDYVQHIDLNFKGRLLVYLTSKDVVVEISTRQSLRFRELMSL